MSNEQQKLWHYEKSPKKKGTCPGCGHNNTFRFYEHVASGQRLPEQFGKCERVNNCNYKKAPTRKELETLGFIFDSVVAQQQPQIKIVYPQQSHLSGLSDLTSVFHEFCRQLGISDEHLTRWHVGTGPAGITQFGLFNSEQKAINLKSVEYELRANGRDCGRKKPKGKVSYLVARSGEKFPMCLYGEHLLTSEKTVCVVESEKTAIIASFFNPQFDWVATGGASGLTAEKIQALFNREILYVNDADPAGRKNSTIALLRSYKQNLRLADLFPGQDEGYDLADAIRDWKFNGQAMPVIKPFSEYPADSEQNRTETTEADAESAISESVAAWGFFEKDGSYWTRSHRYGKPQDREISNFTMKLLYSFPNGSTNTPFLFELTNKSGEKKLLEIFGQDLVNFQRLQGSFISLGNFMFYGAKDDMLKIIGKLRQNEIRATHLSILGQQEKERFFAFSNGILLEDGTLLPYNEHGVVAYNNKTFYCSAASQSNLENNDFSEDRKLTFKSGEIGLREYCQDIYKIYGTEGLVGLCYAIAAIHRDKIFATTKCFPFLFLFGERGRGKTTFIDIFRRLYGEPRQELTDKSTTTAMSRMFAQSANTIIYCKEWSREFDFKASDLLKSAYDGSGYSRAKHTNDLQTSTTRISSAVVFDGNSFPVNDDALFSRLIFMVWAPIFTQESKQQIEKLNDSLTRGAGKVFAEMYQCSDNVRNNFEQVFRSKSSELRGHVKEKNIPLDERDIAHISILLSVFDLVLAPISKNETGYAQLKDKLIMQTVNQSKITASLDVVIDFFETIAQLKNEADSRHNISEGTHYVRETIADLPTGSELLVLAVNEVYSKYSQFKKAAHNTSVLAQVALKERLSQYQYENYLTKPKPGEKDFSKKVGGTAKRCMVFLVKIGEFDLFK